MAGEFAYSQSWRRKLYRTDKRFLKWATEASEVAAPRELCDEVRWVSGEEEIEASGISRCVSLLFRENESGLPPAILQHCRWTEVKTQPEQAEQSHKNPEEKIENIVKTESWQLSLFFLFVSLFLFAYSLSFVCVCVEYFCNYALCIVKCHASSIKHSKERPGTTVFTYKYLFSWREKKAQKVLWMQLSKPHCYLAGNAPAE